MPKLDYARWYCFIETIIDSDYRENYIILNHLPKNMKADHFTLQQWASIQCVGTTQIRSKLPQNG